MLSLAEATEVFAKGFSETKSLVSPYEAVRLGPLWWLRDVPGTRGKLPARKSEILCPGVPPAEVDRLLDDVPGRKFICAIDPHLEGDPEIYNEYRALGYRLMVREPFFAKRLENEAFEDDRARRAHRLEELHEVGACAGRRKMSDETFQSEKQRLYVSYLGGDVAGWVLSVPTAEDRSWVADLYVLQAHCRQGLGMALMRTLLADDEAHGIRYSVLLASKTGSYLYPKAGYTRIGTLQMFFKPNQGSG